MSKVFSTSSLLMASWVLYWGKNPFLGYRDGKFHFADGESTIQFLIAGYHDADPQANIHKFEKCKTFLITERRKDGYSGRENA